MFTSLKSRRHSFLRYFSFDIFPFDIFSFSQSLDNPKYGRLVIESRTSVAHLGKVRKVYHYSFPGSPLYEESEYGLKNHFWNIHFRGCKALNARLKPYSGSISINICWIEFQSRSTAYNYTEKNRYFTELLKKVSQIFYPFFETLGAFGRFSSSTEPFLGAR